MATFYRADGWVKAVTGQAVSGAQIFVCTQPANTVWPVDPVTKKQVPNWQPTPQAAIYADVNGLQAIQQPIFTDGFGHYNFYALTGLYTLVVINNGAVQQVYPDQSLGLFGLVIPPSGNVSGSNLVSNTIILGGGGSNIISGPLLTGDPTKFLSGAGVFSTPPAPSGLTLQTNEVANGSQTLLDLHASTGISLVDNGTGRVTITNTVSGGANFSAAQSGVFYSNSGIYVEGISGGVWDTNLTRVQVALLQIDFAITVRKVTFSYSGSTAGQTVNIGLYTSDGNTKLFDTGAITLSFNASPVASTTTLGAPVLLTPGSYYFAYSVAVHNSAINGNGFTPSTLTLDVLNSSFVRLGTAANALVGGTTLPATLGVLTSVATVYPVILFEA